MTSGQSFMDVGLLFGFRDDKTPREVFYRLLTYHYFNNLAIPLIINHLGQINQPEVDKALLLCFNHMSPYYKELFSNFEDPAGLGRCPVLMNIDATYISIPMSKDQELQKMTYLVHKAHHIMKLTTVTTMEAKPIAVEPGQASQSPSCGDSFLHSVLMERLDSGRGNFIRALLRGNARFFTVMIADAGYTMVLRNAPVNVRNAPTFADICIEENAVFLHTSTRFDPFHLELTSDGRIRKGQVDPDKPTRTENTMTLVRRLRKHMEQFHAGLKKIYQILDDKNVPSGFLLPFRPEHLRRFKIPDTHKSIPKLSIIAVVSCSLFNLFHPGFGLRYIGPNDEITAARMFKARLFLENPLLHNVFDIDLASRNTQGIWSETTFASIGTNNDPIGFPQLQDDEIYPTAVELACGTHALEKGNSVLTYITQLKIKEDGIIGDRAEDMLREFPDFHKLEYCDILTEPSQWDEEMFGEFSPVRLVRSLLPPSYKTATSRANFHYFTIGFSISSQYENRLMLRPPYDTVQFYHCENCPSMMGLLGIDRHGAALLRGISFKNTFKSTYINVHLFSTNAPEHRQCYVGLPPSNLLQVSADVPLNIPRRSRDSRQGQLTRSGNWRPSQLRSSTLPRSTSHLQSNPASPTVTLPVSTSPLTITQPTSPVNTTPTAITLAATTSATGSTSAVTTTNVVLSGDMPTAMSGSGTSFGKFYLFIGKATLVREAFKKKSVEFSTLVWVGGFEKGHFSPQKNMVYKCLKLPKYKY